MSSTNLQDKIATEFNGINDSASTRFTANDTDFVFTDGTIYQSVDGQLCGGHKKVKTINAVKKFVEARI
ncbi:MAG: hypothetical protein Unbinned6437contig1000_58 [Prokaryotic dsDNA virus sp.]|nr:MAG: hypothetical protein Unbinned6437contig1000_58 [Prokaryotic dsDNA virus sp.]|tara:strand:- start:10602 stop:10808 length:207 start_codon:yes stop_codon:yes gene_type:complete